jgi:hypothetical protein
MKHWTRWLLAIAAPLALTGCLWGPGKFTSDLTLRKDGTFTLDYRGQIVIAMPPDEALKIDPWKAEMALCRESGSTEVVPQPVISTEDEADPVRPCTPSETAELKSKYEQQEAARVESKRKENEQMAAALGLPGLDDESNRAFAAKLLKYEGWRSATYRGKGVYDVVYHFEGQATQDFIFPALPDNDLIIPFVAMRRRTDGSVLVTAPAFTGGAGPMGARGGSAAASKMTGDGPQSRAEGRFTIITDGEILTNNSEDGAVPGPSGRQIHWDVDAASNKIPETLIRLN